MNKDNKSILPRWMRIALKISIIGYIILLISFLVLGETFMIIASGLGLIGSCSIILVSKNE